jgi:hypothetical protein
MTSGVGTRFSELAGLAPLDNAFDGMSVAGNNVMVAGKCLLVAKQYNGGCGCA